MWEDRGGYMDRVNHAFCAPGLEGYIETLQGLWKKAKDAGSTIDNAGFIVILLNLFPESWVNITTPLYKQEDLTIIITNLTTHGKQLITINRGKLDRKPESMVPKGDSVQGLQVTIAALQANISLLKGGVTPRRHYMLMAKKDPINLKAIIHTNKPSIDQITMVTVKVPGTMSSVSFTLGAMSKAIKFDPLTRLTQAIPRDSAGTQWESSLVTLW
ncbi:hypothetical protein BT96DRAFT_948834 [Gymnopus androsaceus JB14]|uniref:Uncharacterized protein n=1 Tax=Gymnopus androsaceus JB14 TaxID=1447944 RepID=A0A6A4GM30_9AGAR|nr:hypothetical protein BT96DRAFT_948834 [Gymnopus androsaceus JB14]